MDAIGLAGVSKTFVRKRQRIDALKEVSLVMAEGEVFGFVGPNGAGKSTTIKIILDIIGDYGGEARIFGVSAREVSARRRVGYVPEAPVLHEQLTPLEILGAGLAMHGLRPAQPEAHCLAWLDRLSVAHVARRKVRELSKGTVQRVAIAHAMALDPRLLILDEPLSGLDPVGRKDVVDLLAEYRAHGGSIFLTSHVLHDVERLADRFGLIHQGELKTIRSPSEMVGEEETLTVRSLGEAAIPGMLAETDGRWRIEVTRSELWQLLRALDAAHHSVIEIKPAMTLESAFMRYIGHGVRGSTPSAN